MSLKDEFRGKCEECGDPLEWSDAYVWKRDKDLGVVKPLARSSEFKNIRFVCLGCLEDLEKQLQEKLRKEDEEYERRRMVDG